LSDLERPEHLAERKRLYLLKRPETAKGVAGGTLVRVQVRRDSCLSGPTVGVAARSPPIRNLRVAGGVRIMRVLEPGAVHDGRSPDPSSARQRDEDQPMRRRMLAVLLRFRPVRAAICFLMGEHDPRVVGMKGPGDAWSAWIVCHRCRTRLQDPAAFHGQRADDQGRRP
jgi:hypothetical protein